MFCHVKLLSKLAKIYHEQKIPAIKYVKFIWGDIYLSVAAEVVVAMVTSA